MSAGRALPLFVFGTLRDPDVLALVLGREGALDDARAAWLADQRAVRLPDESYPVLQAAPGERVDGLLLQLDDTDLARVAFFEGEEYDFEHAQVLVASGESVDCLLCGERATRDGPRTPWTLEAWQREHKAEFLRMSAEYMALYREDGLAEAEALWRRLTGKE